MEFSPAPRVYKAEFTLRQLIINSENNLTISYKDFNRGLV